MSIICVTFTLRYAISAQGDDSTDKPIICSFGLIYRLESWDYKKDYKYTLLSSRWQIRKAKFGIINLSNQKLINQIA